MTPFSRKDTALLLIDHQVGTMQLIKNFDVEGAKRMALALAKAAKILDIPVVLTSSQEDRVQGPLLPELETILPEAFAARIKREGIVNAWTDPAFKAAVEATGRKNLIMAGFVATLSNQDIEDLSTYYAGLPNDHLFDLHKRVQGD